MPKPYGLENNYIYTRPLSQAYVWSVLLLLLFCSFAVQKQQTRKTSKITFDLAYGMNYNREMEIHKKRQQQKWVYIQRQIIASTSTIINKYVWCWMESMKKEKEHEDEEKQTTNCIYIYLYVYKNTTAATPNWMKLTTIWK